jgi:hypothetical protein
MPKSLEVRPRWDVTNFPRRSSIRNSSERHLTARREPPDPTRVRARRGTVGSIRMIGREHRAISSAHL